jgi:hypothetical protein
MKDLLKKLEDTFAAAAFAEAGEFEVAREMLVQDDSDKSKKGGCATRQDSMTGQPSEA